MISTTEKQNKIVYICLGYALQKQEDGKVCMAEELIKRLDFLQQKYKESIQDNKGQNEQYTIITSGRGKIDIESRLMKDYLIEKHGIEENHIFQEKYSMNTVENILFCLYYLWNKYENINNNKDQNKFNIQLRVVTSEFHVKRVQYITSSAANVILPIFKNCTFSPIEYLGANTQYEIIEEAKILWEKATDKIHRLLSFNFDINKFMEEREFIQEDKQYFVIYKDQILESQKNQQ